MFFVFIKKKTCFLKGTCRTVIPKKSEKHWNMQKSRPKFNWIPLNKPHKFTNLWTNHEWSTVIVSCHCFRFHRFVCASLMAKSTQFPFPGATGHSKGWALTHLPQDHHSPLHDWSPEKHGETSKQANLSPNDSMLHKHGALASYKWGLKVLIPYKNGLIIVTVVLTLPIGVITFNPIYNWIRGPSCNGWYSKLKLIYCVIFPASLTFAQLLRIFFMDIGV